MGNAASGLPFDNGTPIEYAGHWQLSSGTRKEDKPQEEKEQVTIFKCMKATQAERLPVATRNFQKLRTLKHPYILTYLDGADLEDAVVLVTESCIPLETWIQQQLSSSSSTAAEDHQAILLQEVVWGFRCIVNALQFLHSTCSLLHGYLGLHAIFVSKSGDWKLGSLDLAVNLSTDDVSFFNTYNHLLQRPFISPERQQPNSATTLQSTPGAADMFSLAHCIQTTFDRLALEVPQNFDKYLQRMLVVDIKRRPTAGQLSQCPIFNSDQVRLLISLGDLAIKPPSDSLEILGNLVSRVPEIPRAVCIHKILPSLGRALQMALNDFPTRNARESCRQSVQLSLSLLAQLVAQNKLDEQSYVSKCLPIVVQLWSMSDRAIRTTLLKTLKSLIVVTPAAFVNKSIFDPMLAGFADSNAKMREDTLKNLVNVVDKLDEKNMQEKLTRCISNLQNDAEASIRTNATIFLGRIASRLKEGVRTRVICPAFAKAMRDPFVHCRLAGLKAAVACIELLDVPQLTGKIMPQACTLLVDRSADVREMSLNLLDASTQILRRYHEKTVENDKASAAAAVAAATASGATGAHTNGDANGGSGSGGNSSWTSWVSDGLSKTIEKATDSTDGNTKRHGEIVITKRPADASASSSSSSSSSGGVKTDSRSSSNASIEDNTEVESSFIGNLSPEAEADGWGDDNWGVDDDDDDAGGGGSAETGWANDDDLDLDNDDESPKSSAGGEKKGGLTAQTASLGLNTNSTKTSNIAAPVAEIGGLTKGKSSIKAKPVVKKLGSSKADDWGEDDW